MSQTDDRYTGSGTSMEPEKIEILSLLLDFLRVFRRMWIYVLIFALIGSGLSGYRANAAYVPYYMASATFTVNIYSEQVSSTTSSTSFYDSEAAEQMARVFPHILTSGVLLRRVAKDLGVDVVSGSISAAAEANTNLFTLSVRDRDPERAYATLQSVLKNYPEISETVIGKVNMKLFDESGVPTYPANGKALKGAIAKGALAGAALAFMWMVLVTLSRKTVRREEDCPKYIHKKCLGTVPYIRPKRRSDDISRYLNISDEATHVDFTESIRIIRNKVTRSAKENGIKVILVTSAMPGEGKSTIATNLAISLAQEGKYVALVDCDFRNPSDDEVLKIKTDKGMTDVINGKAKVSECLKKIEVDGVRGKVKMLYLPVGKAVQDPSTMLGSEYMRQIIHSMRRKMDYVILDSAPVGLLTDASVLAQHADGAIFVVKKDFAKVDHLLSGMGHLLEANVHVLGCVLNGD